MRHRQTAFIRTPASLRLFALLLIGAIAQGQGGLDPQGMLRMETTPAPLGGLFTMTLEGFPFAPYLVAVDIAPGHRNFPGFGAIELGLTPSIQVPIDGLDGSPVLPLSGVAVFPVPLANAPSFDGAYIYMQAIGYDPGSPSFFAISNARSVQFTYADTYHPTLGGMSLARAFHQVARLENGAVLVIGGGNGALLLPVASTTCERYDPYRRVFLPDTPMNVERTLHRVTELSDGRILVTGGCMTFGAGHATAEIYDPTTQQWTMVPMNAIRIGHSATRLADGRVLVAGGSSSFVLTPPTSTNYLPIFNSATASAEIFDPLTNTFTPAGNALPQARFGHAATLLPNGQVLISGGIRAGQTIFGTGAPQYAQISALFDPVTNTFAASGNMLIPRVVHTQDLLPNGTVLAVGGAGGTFVSSLGSTEIFDPSTGMWTAGPSLPASQTLALHTSTRRSNGSIYIGGGAIGAVGAFQGVTTAYRFDLGTGFTSLSPLASARQAHATIELPEGILLLGGANAGNPTAIPPISAQAISTATLWTPN